VIEQEHAGPSATVKFYTGFLLAVALVVAASFLVGYRAGIAMGMHMASAHRAP